MFGKSKSWVIFGLITLLALAFRVRGLNHPFWVDEFSSAIQAALIHTYQLSVFQQNEYYFEFHNITTHSLIALFFTLFGTSEVVARLPTVIIGSLVTGFIYLLGKKLYSETTGIVAGVLTALSYYQITWSQQARGYMLQQLLVLAALWLYNSILGSKKTRWWQAFTLAFVVLVGLLTHITFILVIAALVVHWMVTHHKTFMRLLTSPAVLLTGVGGVLLLFVTGSSAQIFKFVLQFTQVGLSNNIWYYHAFLWREQTLITFLGLLGLSLMVLKNIAKHSVLPLVLGFYLLFFGLIFPPYVTRYMLPIFPLLILGMAVTLQEFSSLLAQHTSFLNKKIWPTTYLVIMVLFILVSGNTFVLKPKTFYSVNHFMREIPLLDYNLVYDTIKQTVQNTSTPVAVIETWADRGRWYVGLEYPHLFIYRWSENSGTTNGLSRETHYELNKEGVKYVPRTGNPPLQLISTEEDLIRVVSEYPQGFIWIDDETMPREVQEYAHKNFHLELFLDRYPLDDNPLSSWPGKLYSWGVTTPHPLGTTK